MVDAGQPEQRREQVGMVGRNLELAGAAGQQGLEMMTGRAGFFVGAVPLLVKAAVRALHAPWSELKTTIVFS